MRTKKRLLGGLVTAFISGLFLALVITLAPTHKALAAVDPALWTEANNVCKSLRFDTGNKLSGCTRGFLGQKGGKKLADSCPSISDTSGECTGGWNAAAENASADSSQTKDLGEANDACYQEPTVPKQTGCARGYIGFLYGSTAAEACNNSSGAYNAKDAEQKDACTRGYETGLGQVQFKKYEECKNVSDALLQACQTGVEGKRSFYKPRSEACANFNGSGHDTQKNACDTAYDKAAYQVTDDMKDGCKKYAPGGSDENDIYLRYCYAGFAKTLKCDAVSGDEYRNACKEGLDAANSGGTADATCEQKASGLPGIALTWISCEVLRGMGGIGDTLNDIINSQLDFNIHQNLNGNVKQAWNIMRVLSTLILVVILLIVIISQAIGSGPFEAYTIRKLLPKIVVAVIIIQLSWVISVYVITLSNDAGKGIQELLAAPFGGMDNLSLDKLVSNLGAGATITGASGVVAGMFTLLAVAAFNPFGALLVVFLAFMGLLIGFGALLVRQALILGCVIFMPIAMVLWILSGTQSYYKKWYDNYTKLLILFPLISGLIVIGRIFAWIVGGSGSSDLATSVMTLGHHVSPVVAIGSAGFIDLMAIFIGYFGVFYLFPKALTSWGGSMMSGLTQGVQKGMAPLRKVGEKEIGGMKERHQGKMGNKYDPDSGRQNRLKRAYYRAGSGNYVPTERGRRLTIAKGNKWKSDRNEEGMALAKRTYEKALSEGYTDGTGKKHEAGLGAGKQALLDLAGNSGKSDADQRAAAEAMKYLVDTSSWIELQGSTISQGGNAGKRIMDVPGWAKMISNNPEYWGKVSGKRPDTLPPIVNSTYGETDADIDKKLDSLGLNDAEKAERKAWIAAEQIRTGKKKINLHPTDRLTSAMEDFMEPNSYSGVAEGFYDDVSDRLKGDVAKGIAPDASASRTLAHELEQIAKTGRAGEQVLGHLSVGSVRTKVDRALGGSGDGALIDRLVARAKVYATGGNPDQMAESTVGTMSQTLNKEGASDVAINDAVTSMGGWDKLPEHDLVEFYGTRSGPIKEMALTELQRRGRMPGGSTSSGGGTSGSSGSSGSGGTSGSGTPPPSGGPGGGGGSSGSGTPPPAPSTSSSGSGPGGSFGAPPSPSTPSGPPIDYTELGHTLERAVERGIGRSQAARADRPTEPTEIRIEHGPEITGTGTQFDDSRIYRPQERRSRPQSSDDGSGGDSTPPNPPPPPKPSGGGGSSGSGSSGGGESTRPSSPRPSSSSGGGTTTPALTTDLPRVKTILDKALAEENKNVEASRVESAQKGTNSIWGRKRGPVVEALRETTGGNEDELVKLTASLALRVQTLTDTKYKNPGGQRYFGIGKAVEEVFKDLPPATVKAIEEALKREAQRQYDEAPDGTVKAQVVGNPESVFRSFISDFVQGPQFYPKD
jgi:hypothetical protein